MPELSLPERLREIASGIRLEANQRGDGGGTTLYRDADAVERASFLIPSETLDRGDSLGLPLPRLQLTWERGTGFNWLCYYELLIPVQKWDIRNEEHECGYTVALIGSTKTTPGRDNWKPLESDGMPTTPFRDHLHALLDSERLNLPAFVVWGTGYRRLEKGNANATV